MLATTVPCFKGFGSLYISAIYVDTFSPSVRVISIFYDNEQQPQLSYEECPYCEKYFHKNSENNQTKCALGENKQDY